MKKKKFQNNSGITVCDSIVMSVKRKNADLRRIEAIIIALTGYVSTIMVFMSMFDFNYDKKLFIAAATGFSVAYILISLMKKNALWLIIVSVMFGGAALWRSVDSISLGYKFVYNIIYRTSLYTKIDYYKFLDKTLEQHSVTTFFIFAAWILAIVIYVFTIYHPHPLPSLITIFSILEIGMYNGLKLPIFWGMMAIAFLLAEFAMCTIDIGEYSGGNGGFVRKENLFFPKRQMKLKVTEKCGLYLIILVMAVATLSAAGLKISGYKRSEELNQKRIEIKDAVNSFSIENLADSLSNITAAFGFTFKVETHKLGNVDFMKYKDRTDMKVTVDKKINGAIYLKEYTGSVYRNNEWVQLPDSAFRDPVFTSFSDYNIYPQDFPFRFNKLFNQQDPEYTIWINSLLSNNRSFAPYGTDNIGGLTYNRDSDVSSKSRTNSEFSYKFSLVNAEAVSYNMISPVRNSYSIENVADQSWKNTILDYSSNHELISYDNYLYIDSELPSDMDIMYSNPALIMTELIQEDYEKFVYDHYLQLPDDENIAEVREAFSDILETANNSMEASEKIALLNEIRNRVSSMVEYSLHPGKTPKNRDFVNYFLLENHKGYCTHYATTGVILARMAGIPARFATGYVLVGDDFNSSTQNADGTYSVNVKDNRSHAWAEIYLSGYGWVPFEFTAGYSDQTIDTTPTETTTTAPVENTETTTVDESRQTETTNSNEQQTATTRNTDDNNAATTADNSVGTTDVSGGGDGNGGKKAVTIPESVKNAIYCVFIAAALVAFVILRRKFIIFIRLKKFTTGSGISRICCMYRFTEKIFRYKKIERDKMNFTEFTRYVESSCGNIYFAQDEFEDFMAISLSAVFSDKQPTQDEIDRCCKFTNKLIGKVYENSSAISKIYLKYVICYI